MRTVPVRFYYHIDNENVIGGHMRVLPVREDIAAELEGTYDAVEAIVKADGRYPTAGLAIDCLLELETGVGSSVFVDRIELVQERTI